MRTFQLISIFLFLGFYSFISFGAIKSLLRITPITRKKKVLWYLLIVSGSFLIGFILLYVWPMTTRNLKGYTIHLIFNALLSIDFVFKLSLTVSFLLGFIFKEKWKNVTYIIGLILSIGISSSVLYGALFGRKNLMVNYVALNFKNLPNKFDGLTILQISDTHLGGFMGSNQLLKKVAEEIDLLNPDLILFSGDLVNNFSDELDGWERIFQEITKNRKCYSILGNHDYGNYSNWKNDSTKIENFKYMKNSSGKNALYVKDAVCKKCGEKIIRVIQKCPSSAVDLLRRTGTDADRDARRADGSTAGIWYVGAGLCACPGRGEKFFAPTVAAVSPMYWE